MIFCEETPCLEWKSVDAGQWKRLERGKRKGGDLKKLIEFFKRRMMATWSEEAAEKKKRRRRNRFGRWQIWRITNYLAMYILSQSSGKTNKLKCSETYKHPHQFWYWIGCNDYLVAVFASLKLTDNLVNLIWIFKWFTTNQPICFPGSQFFRIIKM